MDRIQTQASKLWDLLFDEETANTYQTALNLTGDILKESAQLIWLILCSVFVFGAWFADASTQTGKGVRNWIENRDAIAPSPDAAKQISAQKSKSLLDTGREKAAAALAKAREELGLDPNAPLAAPREDSPVAKLVTAPAEKPASSSTPKAAEPSAATSAAKSSETASQSPAASSTATVTKGSAASTSTSSSAASSATDASAKPSAGAAAARPAASEGQNIGSKDAASAGAGAPTGGFGGGASRLQSGSPQSSKYDSSQDFDDDIEEDSDDDAGSSWPPQPED